MAAQLPMRFYLKSEFAVFQEKVAVAVIDERVKARNKVWYVLYKCTVVRVVRLTLEKAGERVLFVIADTGDLHLEVMTLNGELVQQMLKQVRVEPPAFFKQYETCMRKFLREKFFHFAHARYNVRMEGSIVEIRGEAAAQPLTGEAMKLLSGDFEKDLQKNDLFARETQSYFARMDKAENFEPQVVTVRDVMIVALKVFAIHISFVTESLKHEDHSAPPEQVAAGHAKQHEHKRHPKSLDHALTALQKEKVAKPQTSSAHKESGKNSSKKEKKEQKKAKKDEKEHHSKKAHKSQPARRELRSGDGLFGRVLSSLPRKESAPGTEDQSVFAPERRLPGRKRDESVRAERNAASVPAASGEFPPSLGAVLPGGSSSLTSDMSQKNYDQLGKSAAKHRKSVPNSII